MADSSFRGQITRVTSAGLFVLVPKLGLNVEYGPCLKVGGGNYDGGYANVYTPGAQVLVQTINGIPDDLVVVGVLS